MMTPLLWQPLAHVWDRSLVGRRVRAAKVGAREQPITDQVGRIELAGVDHAALGRGVFGQRGAAASEREE